MKVLNIKFLFTAVLLSTLTLFSCAKKEPITTGSNVTITNTFQATANTGGVETPIEDLFGMSTGALAASSTISESVEFSKYLLGLYDIDIDATEISFTLVAPSDDPTYSSFFRTLEVGTTDRYYLTFEEDQNVSGYSSDNASVKLRIDSDKVLVVEIGEGFDFNPGSSFTISLN